MGPSPGRGYRLVTGTFAHQAANVVDLSIEGRPEPIGCTANHPFWSETRRRFVPAGELFQGETLRTASGDLRAVVGILPRPAATPVHNLEIDAEHVYYVSDAGVLVHNSYIHPNSKLSPRANHVYEIRNKVTGQIRKYGISSDRISRAGKSYRAQKQVNKLNRQAGGDVYESKILARNLTRQKALSMEQGRVNGYSRSVGAAKPTGPSGNDLPQPQF